jgi:hypothetical protein
VGEAIRYGRDYRDLRYQKKALLKIWLYLPVSKMVARMHHERDVLWEDLANCGRTLYRELGSGVAWKMYFDKIEVRTAAMYHHHIQGRLE